MATAASLRISTTLMGARSRWALCGPSAIPPETQLTMVSICSCVSAREHRRDAVFAVAAAAVLLDERLDVLGPGRLVRLAAGHREERCDAGLRKAHRMCLFLSRAERQGPMVPP
jgi:hypothetical protein